MDLEKLMSKMNLGGGHQGTRQSAYGQSSDLSRTLTALQNQCATSDDSKMVQVLMKQLDKYNQVRNRELDLMEMYMKDIRERKEEISKREKETREMQLEEIKYLKKRAERQEEKIEKMWTELRERERDFEEKRERSHHLDRMEYRRREKEFQERWDAKDRELAAREDALFRNDHRYRNHNTFMPMGFVHESVMEISNCFPGDKSFNHLNKFIYEDEDEDEEEECLQFGMIYCRTVRIHHGQFFSLDD